MPRAKKPPGQAVDKRNGQKLTAVPSGSVEPLEPPEGLSAPSLAAWESFWEDRQAAFLTPSSTVVLLRWIDALDRYTRTTAEADKEPLVKGSTGQLVVNPLYKIAESARSTVEACEKQLGIGGLNAASLGIAAVQEARSLADMNAKYSKPEGVASLATEDPRLTIIEGQAV